MLAHPMKQEACEGTEDRLTDCLLIGRIGKPPCGSGKSASVLCVPVGKSVSISAFPVLCSIQAVLILGVILSGRPSLFKGVGAVA